MIDDDEDEATDDDDDDLVDETEEEQEERARWEASDRVLSGLNELASSWSKPPRSLAHYTSLQNAIRIVNSGEIWLFNAYTMNDELEVDHALDLISDQIKVGEFKSLWDNLHGHFKSRRQAQRVYVFCLSSEESHGLDRLSMWRAYGDDGNGVALKFWTGALLSGDNPNLGASLSLARVVYKNDKKVERVSTLVRKFRELCTKEPEFEEGQLVDALATSLWKLAPTFKHETFGEEGEWRIVAEVERPFLGDTSGGADKIEFLEDQRPFVRLSLGQAGGESILDVLHPTTFEGVLIGPSKNTRANEAAIGAALMKRQGTYKVETSKIPYRGRRS